ncbi:uncharacterized protein LOC122403027 [Colletes gigas]|uniref:uncharacterized protein LOC122403027 n=1 Tax=Colletes gigas TaxID=935657 RepID=UPI001C9A76AC|nr:uncharacterized protein LOC122403027 [Colletes gigas]
MQDNNGHILQPLLSALRYINRPFVIKGQQLQAFLQALRDVANSKSCYDNENCFTDDDFKTVTPITKEQFQDLYTYCDRVPQEHGFRNISKKDLLTFLYKLRQGLSDEFLKVIFRYSSRQSVSLAITKVRQSLLQRFVPMNIGFQAITRDEYITNHVTSFANELYNSEPSISKVIAYIDGTYSYINKSSNFRVLRQTYSVHKGRHLVKPALIVAPDGYILAIQGPYFSDSRNNDARMLNSEFERDVNDMRQWFQDGDIFVLDRGYQDAQPLLRELGIHYRMPALLECHQKQLSTEEANESRLVTKTRWIVETRNGHIKSIFKFFNHIINMHHIHHLGEFYNIAGAIINKYHPLISMEGVNTKLAQELLHKSKEVNVVHARVEIERLCYRNAMWIHLNDEHLHNFPHLTLEYLRDLTIGTFQVRLARSYVQDKMQRDDTEEFQLDSLLDEPGLIRVRVFSRFRNATKHQIFIAYNILESDGVDDDTEPILGYYCTCKSGARTLGTCSHVASVLWYLGYARYQDNVRYPSSLLLEILLDAAHRPPQQHPNENFNIANSD